MQLGICVQSVNFVSSCFVVKHVVVTLALAPEIGKLIEICAPGNSHSYSPNR